MIPPNLNALWAQTLVDALAGAGIRHVCLSPGSRSTPLSLAAYAHADLSTTVHLDERSAAFFALGLAKAQGLPVALICTSGTAAANYHPAVIEASLSRVPLIVLSADRPPELRQAGAAQTIDQVRLFGGAIRFFQDLPVPEASMPLLRTLQVVVRQAVTHAVGHPAGPVHLNVPLRDPLPPVPLHAERMAELSDALDAEIALGGPILPSVPQPSGPALIRVADALSHSRRPLMVAGPQSVRPDEVAAVTRFAERFEIPVLTDIASGLRFHESPWLLSTGDAFLRAEAVASQPPDLVLRIGDLPTSKAVNEYLARHRAPTVMVAPDRFRHDPEALVGLTLEAEVGMTLDRLSELLPGLTLEADWGERFRELEARAARVMTESRLPVEGAATRAAVRALPAGGCAFFSNSMPIRHGETFCREAAPGVRVHVSRGANGIDGIPSTALGIARGSGAPTLLVTGDLAFLHDMGGLAAARGQELTMVVLLLNNDGGGIFNFLPISGFPEVFEPLFGTPHGLDLSLVSRLFGWEHERLAAGADVEEALEKAFARGGLHVIEVSSVREETARAHRTLMSRLVEALEEVPC